jgi:hypothetical protein
MKTDSVFLSRDIDGSGKRDYVVKESKPGSVSSMRAYRLAVYLDKDPRTRKPAWSMAWDDEFGGDQTLGRVLSLAPGATLLDVQWAGGDYDGTVLLIAERGRIRQEITHGVDYGHGFFDIKQDGRNVVVDATLANLELRGKPVKPGIKCLEPEVRAVQLRYDAKTRGFIAGRIRCAKIPGQ